MKRTQIFIASLFLCVCFSSFMIFIPNEEEKAMLWAQDKICDMSMDEMIGQLFMIRGHSDLGDDHVKEVKRQIKEYKVGGICFFQGTPEKQAKLTNEYQKLSDIPLMIGMDAEWGLGMRMKKETISFPKNLTLGAIKHTDNIFNMGKEMGRQLKRLGVHINFAPVVDVNNNAANPVIHNRSFGEDIFNVTSKSYAIMLGMQDEGVLACAKHFPGHGDTNLDSHLDLPVIEHSRQRIDSLELMPFKALSQLGIQSVMTAHLHVPSIDDEKNRPTSLSKKAIRDILIDELKFEGLIFTDALEMKGVSKHFASGQAEVEALKAGNDVLLLPINIDLAFKKIKSAIQSGELDSTDIANKAKKILKYKFLAGLDQTPEIKDIDNLSDDLNSKDALALKSNLYKEAVTLLKNSNVSLPLRELKNLKIGSVSLGSKEVSAFQKRLLSYANVENLATGESISAQQQSTIKNRMALKDVVIISLHDMNIYAKKNYGLSQDQLDLIFELNSQNKVVLVNFGSPYALKYFEGVPNIIQAYEEDEICQDVTAQTIMGANAFRGLLPVTVSQDFTYRKGSITADLGRLKYGIPEAVGLSSDSLKMIKEIVDEMIKEKAAPGCQILAIKDGQVVYDEVFGYHTYNKKKKVQHNHVYDVASVTKILATTISLMKLEEEGLLNAEGTIDQYLPTLDTCNKGDLIIKDVLAHHAKLPGWIAFYENTIEEVSKKKSKPSEEYYRPEKSDSFCIEVVDDLFLRCDYRDSIYERIYACDLRDNDKYRYSDLGFYLFHQMIPKLSGLTLNTYAHNAFYKSLGLEHTCFNPSTKLDMETIVPSEDDDYFRNQIVHGYVHDMGAAMLGGVAGHAGLFSNSKDLGVLMQMLLNGGQYGGEKYLDEYTIRKYTSRHHKSTRRGLGFDMKELDEEKTMNMSELASPSTFGHLGFTGTATFCDPEHNLIYIFLSNRTFPTMNNKKFSRNEYRPRIQSVFYQAMEEKTHSS